MRAKRNNRGGSGICSRALPNQFGSGRRESLCINAYASTNELGRCRRGRGRTHA